MPITVRSRQRDLELSVKGGEAAFDKLQVHELKSIW
jgi:hypothetical protein